MTTNKVVNDLQTSDIIEHIIVIRPRVSFDYRYSFCSTFRSAHVTVVVVAVPLLFVLLLLLLLLSTSPPTQLRGFAYGSLLTAVRSTGRSRSVLRVMGKFYCSRRGAERTCCTVRECIGSQLRGGRILHSARRRLSVEFHVTHTPVVDSDLTWQLWPKFHLLRFVQDLLYNAVYDKYTASRNYSTANPNSQEVIRRKSIQKSKAWKKSTSCTDHHNT